MKYQRRTYDGHIHSSALYMDISTTLRIPLWVTATIVYQDVKLVTKYPWILRELSVLPHPSPLPQITVSKSYLWAIPGSMACFSNRKIKCSWINSLFLEYWNITISAPDAKCWLRTIHAYKTDFKDNALIQHSNIGSQSYLVNVKRMCRRIHKEEKEFIIWLSANKIKWILKAFPSIVATTRTLLDQSLIRYLIKWVYIPLYACEILNGH